MTTRVSAARGMQATEALEVRFESARLGQLVLIASVSERGVIHYTLTNGRGGMAQALSNLQITVPVPMKAVVGWQTEAVSALATGLWPIVEVR